MFHHSVGSTLPLNISFLFFLYLYIFHSFSLPILRVSYYFLWLFLFISTFFRKRCAYFQFDFRFIFHTAFSLCPHYFSLLFDLFSRLARDYYFSLEKFLFQHLFRLSFHFISFFFIWRHFLYFSILFDWYIISRYIISRYFHIFSFLFFLLLFLLTFIGTILYILCHFSWLHATTSATISFSFQTSIFSQLKNFSFIFWLVGVEFRLYFRFSFDFLSYWKRFHY